MKRRFKRAFGVDVQGTFARSLVVLDKSFLQGVTAQELRFYVKHGWIFGVTETLQYEHFRKWDRWMSRPDENYITGRSENTSV
jgi:hypothetical protein